MSCETAAAKPVNISFEDAAAQDGLRKPSQRQGTLRIITIEGFDKSACGGTHLRNTSEIGAILIRKSEKLRGQVRMEFVCGDRALRWAKKDFVLLSALSRQLSVPFEKTPEVAATLSERNKLLEKQNQKLSVELAQREGRELWAATVADENISEADTDKTSWDAPGQWRAASRDDEFCDAFR